MHKELRAYLKRSKQSQRQFAAEIGIDPTLVCRWLSGKRKPARSVMAKVSKKTGIALEAMV